MEIQNQISRPLSKQSWWFKALTYPWVQLYAFCLKLRGLLYSWGLLKVTKLPGHCISVGNLTMGGTGKTPVVVELAKYFLSLGKSVAILTRGYKSGLGTGDFVVLKAGEVLFTSAKGKKFHADEAYFQSNSLPVVPVIVGANRVAAARQCLADRLVCADLWIVDDGYQHFGLHRDCNLLLLDSRLPLGNKMLIPAGQLREPPKAVERASMILETRFKSPCSQSRVWKEIKERFSNIPIVGVEFNPGQILPIVNSHTKPLSAFLQEEEPRMCVVLGIAQPQSFLENLEACFARASEVYLLSDHEKISMSTLKEKITYCDLVVTSAKDYWRDPGVFISLPIPCYILDLQICLPLNQMAPMFERLTII